MKKIANVVYKEPLVNHTKVDYINYINNIEENQIISDIPILTVGWKYLKSIGDNSDLSILNKEIEKNNRYWEFSFNENKSQHITGIDMFVRNVPIYFFESKYKYKLIDPVKEKFFDVFNIINWYNSKTGGIEVDAIYNYKNKMTYILRDDTVYGIDRNMWKFFGMNNASEAFMSSAHILSPEKNTIDDPNGDIYAKYNKIFNGYDNLKRYLVVLLSK